MKITLEDVLAQFPCPDGADRARRLAKEYGGEATAHELLRDPRISGGNREWFLDAVVRKKLGVAHDVALAPSSCPGCQFYRSTSTPLRDLVIGADLAFAAEQERGS